MDSLKHFSVGDPHGDWMKWQHLMSKLRKMGNTRIIIHGDVIDRKEHGLEIMKEIMNSPSMTLLLGNHEYMMRDVVNAELHHHMGSDYEEKKDLWYDNGGQVTHRKFLELSPGERIEINDYLSSLPVNIDLMIGNQPFKLVHAAPIEWYRNHPEYVDATEYAVWHRWGCNYPCSKDYTVVFAHTPTEIFQDGSPMRIWRGTTAFGIDTGASYPDNYEKKFGIRGRLAALCLEDLSEYYSEE